MVLTVISILAAVTVPKLTAMSSYAIERAGHELARHIAYARTMAIATQRHTWITFNTASESYSVYIEDPNNPGRANRIYMTDPVNGGNFVVTLNTGDYAGIVIDSAAFGSGTELEFDWSGTPYNGNAVALTSDGTVTLGGSGTRTVRVSAETGCVQEQ